MKAAWPEELGDPLQYFAAPPADGPIEEPPPPPTDLSDYGLGDVAAARSDLASPPTNNGQQPRFRLIPFDQMKVGDELAYLVKGLIPRRGLVVVWGPPKCGKSFWVFDLTMHAALGWRYRDRKVQGGPVVYCAFEGVEGYGKRAEAFRQRHLAQDAGPIPFYLVTAPMTLAKDHGELIRAILMQLGGLQPVAVVLDTLNRSLGGSESDDKDMGGYVRAGDAVREALNCVVIVIHHCGIEGTRPRGHTSLTGAVDAQLAVKRESSGTIKVTVEWMKDGPEGDIIYSRLEGLEVGRDIDGDPITSCVVEAVEGGGGGAPPARRLSDAQQLGLDALDECAASGGEPPPASFGLPAGLVAVRLEGWRTMLYSRGALDRDAKNPRTDFARLRKQLLARRLIGERDGLVWRATDG